MFTGWKPLAIGVPPSCASPPPPPPPPHTHTPHARPQPKYTYGVMDHGGGGGGGDHACNSAFPSTRNLRVWLRLLVLLMFLLRTGIVDMFADEFLRHHAEYTY